MAMHMNLKTVQTELVPLHSHPTLLHLCSMGFSSVCKMLLTFVVVLVNVPVFDDQIVEYQ